MKPEVRAFFDEATFTVTYVVSDLATKRAAVIDPVRDFDPSSGRTSTASADAVIADVRARGLGVDWILETHVHADHVTGAALLRRATGAKIAVAEAGGAEGADRQLVPTDVVDFGQGRLTVRATPGHTEGCVTYVLGDRSMAFTGDALLIRGCGRTDFQGGDPRTLFRSIREQILTLPPSCALYPAHDYAGRTLTTVAEERSFNARVGGRASEHDFVGYMENLDLPHPKRIDEAVPANLRCGRFEGDEEAEVPLWGPVVHSLAGIPEISAEWVAYHLSAVTVVDVRDAEELEDPDLRPIAGALHIPLRELDDRCAALPPDRPVVVVCRSGRRSAQGTVILRRRGRVDSANVRGGMLRWHGLGLDAAVSQVS